MPFTSAHNELQEHLMIGYFERFDKTFGGLKLMISRLTCEAEVVSGIILHGSSSVKTSLTTLADNQRRRAVYTLDPKETRAV